VRQGHIRTSHLAFAGFDVSFLPSVGFCIGCSSTTTFFHLAPPSVMLNLRFARAMLQYLDESQQQGPHPFVVLDLAARQERGPIPAAGTSAPIPGHLWCHLWFFWGEYFFYNSFYCFTFLAAFNYLGDSD
jgi:hypothetical protein